MSNDETRDDGDDLGHTLGEALLKLDAVVTEIAAKKPDEARKSVSAAWLVASLLEAKRSDVSVERLLFEARLIANRINRQDDGDDGVENSVRCLTSPDYEREAAAAFSQGPRTRAVGAIYVEAIRSDAHDGYIVQRCGGCELTLWSTEAFERTFLELDADRPLDVTGDPVENMIADVTYRETDQACGTIVSNVTARNGFGFAGVFAPVLGTQRNRAEAIRRAHNRATDAMGVALSFVLRWGIEGLERAKLAGPRARHVLCDDGEAAEADADAKQREFDRWAGTKAGRHL